jgi:hypothetical protein
MICALAMFINLSQEPFNPRDFQEYTAARPGCARHYPEAPCVKKFIKVEHLMYRVICGINKGEK